MDFITSAYYLYFLPVVFLLTFTVASANRRRPILILLVMSYIFFWLASGWHLILLLASTLVDWTAGKKMHETEDDRLRKRWLRISLVTNLTLLGVFKYLDFILQSWNLASLRFTDALEVGTLGLALPVGISFYTFQTMSYTIDIYRKKQTPYDSLLDFACYAAFFPQLVAGPIVRADHFREQIKAPLVPSAHRFRLGLTFIIYGITKKLVIADNVAVHANEVFVEGEHLANIGLIWWATLCLASKFTATFQPTPTLPSARLILSGWNFLKTSKRRTPLLHHRISGVAGTSRSPRGSAIISTSHLGARVKDGTVCCWL